MDNLTQRRIVAVVGLIIAFVGLTALVWGILNRNGIIELVGFICILLAYVCTVIMKRLQPRKGTE